MTGAASADLSAGRESLLAGDAHAAIAALTRAVDAAPGDIETRYWLASAKFTANDATAAAAMDEARTLHALTLARSLGTDLARCQTDTAYADDIANQLYARKLVAMSSVVRRLALDAGVCDAQQLLSFGLALQHQGRHEEASEVFRLAADRFASGAVDEFLIYAQLLGEGGERSHFEAARAWAKRHAPAAPAPPHRNPSREGRRLRIGYVAPWFATCQLKQFIGPLLENHDPQSVAVTLYPIDAASEAGWPEWIDVRPLGGLSDAAAADLIRSDGIDVLADCWGHAAGSRLPVFARRPAPVQAAWINYVQTSGLAQMDYVLHADCTEGAAGVGDLFTEQIWRIGPVFNAFRPAEGRLEPMTTPALRTGQVTFASFNHPAKLSGEALDAWAAVLRGAPGARLLLKYGYYADPVLQRVTQARFAARGVAPERIVFAGHSTGRDYLRSYQHVDLMLDAWPSHGSTTTLDALSNGAPVLVMDAPGCAGPYVRSILQACGLPELIAATPTDFVDRALALAADPARLDALRARVRPGFDNGPLADEAGFTRRVEAAFAAMFDRWFAAQRLVRAVG